MKNNNYTFLLLLIISPLYILCQTYSIDSYDFPVKPGEPEWKELKTNIEKIEALQLPDSVLLNISTVGLVKTCLNYPLAGNIVFYNTYQEGFDIVFKGIEGYEGYNGFNGYKELIKRQDVGSIIIDIFSSEFVENNLSIFLDQNQPQVFNLLSIEMLLAQNEILQELSDEEKIDLCKLILSKTKPKSKDVVSSSNITKRSACLILVRILVSLKDSEMIDMVSNDVRLYNFSEMGHMVDINLLDQIISTANSIMDKKY